MLTFTKDSGIVQDYIVLLVAEELEMKDVPKILNLREVVKDVMETD